MSIKSVLRALRARFVWSGTDIADVVRGVSPAPTPFLERLTSRRDWATEAETYLPDLIVKDGEGVARHCPSVPGFAVRAAEAFNRDAQAVRPDKWPAGDDPYAKPEPCPVVPDPAISTIGNWASRTNRNTGEIIDMIARQEAAERELRHRGMVWDRAAGRWRDPEGE